MNNRQCIPAWDHDWKVKGHHHFDLNQKPCVPRGLSEHAMITFKSSWVKLFVLYFLYIRLFQLDWLGSETPKCICSFAYESVNSSPAYWINNVVGKMTVSDNWRLWDKCSQTIFYNFRVQFVPFWQVWLVSESCSALEWILI